MPEVIQDEFEWEVENILLHREVKSGSRSKTEFLIKWVGFGPEHCTWEPEKNLTNCKDLSNCKDFSLFTGSNRLS